MNSIHYKKEGFTGELVINRPKALNALNSQLISELSMVLDEAGQDDIRALIIWGTGEKAFVSGADIGEMWNYNQEQSEVFCQEGNAVMEKIEQFPVPVIAAVNGIALGGGFELALSCDIRLAAEHAVFGFPEVSLGIIPGFGGLQRLVRFAGIGTAKKLIFTAKRIGAEEALAAGIIDQICTKESLLNEARMLAEQISQNAPIAVREAKKVMNDSIGLTLNEAGGLEKKGFGKCFNSEDQYHAMGLFLKKLKPIPFQGK